MLYTGATIEVQVFFDLRFTPSLGRLGNREFETPPATLHHLGHQRRILGTDGTVIKVNELRKAQHPLVECDPLVHLAQLNVAYDMIDGSQSSRPGPAGNTRVQSLVSGHEDAFIILAFHKRKNGVAINSNCRGLHHAVIIFAHGWLPHTSRATAPRLSLYPLRVIATPSHNF